MKTLIIVANPRIDSFSFAIAKKYEELALNKGYSTKKIDLYKNTNQQPFYIPIENKKENITKEMLYFQDKINWADELVFVFPVWWGGMPAILKNFIDWNLSKGFAFEYKNSRPNGLLDKKVKIFTTTGTPSIIYAISGAKNRLRNTLKKQIFKFCGMKLIEFNIYGGINKKETNTKKILDKIKI